MTQSVVKALDFPLGNPGLCPVGTHFSVSTWTSHWHIWTLKHRMHYSQRHFPASVRCSNGNLSVNTLVNCTVFSDGRFLPTAPWRCWLDDRKGIQHGRNHTPAVPRGGALEDLRAPGLTGSDLWKNRLGSQKPKVVVVMVVVVVLSF